MDSKKINLTFLLRQNNKRTILHKKYVTKNVNKYIENTKRLSIQKLFQRDFYISNIFSTIL